MDGTKKTGGRLELVGILGVAILDVFIALNFAASAVGGMWLVPISTGDLCVGLLANAVMVFFLGHLLHDHTHTEQIEEHTQPTTAR